MIYVEPRVSAGECVQVLIRAFDAENNPVTGLEISLVAIAMEGPYTGDYRRELEISELGEGAYTAALCSTWAGDYKLVAWCEGIRAHGFVEFVPGAPTEVRFSEPELDPSLEPCGFNLLVYAVDEYGNVIDNLLPSVDWGLGRVENLKREANGAWSVSVVVENWGADNLKVTDNLTGLTGSIELLSPAVYATWELVCGPPLVESLENERAEVVGKENDNLCLRVSVIWLEGEFGSYGLSLEFDNEVLEIIDIKDGDPDDGFGEPTVQVLDDNLLRLLGWGSAFPGKIDIIDVYFAAKEFGAIENSFEVIIKDVDLYALEVRKIYEKGHLVGMEKVEVKVEIPLVAEVVMLTLKFPKWLWVYTKFWIMENAMTRASLEREIEETENHFRKAFEDCKLDFVVDIHPVVNSISKDNWNAIVGTDGKLTGTEDQNLFKKFQNYAALNVYVVPPCSLGDDAIGWWWDEYRDPLGERRTAIFTDESKDIHDRNLTHELMHEFSGSRVKDSPVDNAAAQGGRDSNNVMNYCGGGHEISAKQGEILNEEVRKRAKSIDFDNDGVPDMYVWPP